MTVEETVAEPRVLQILESVKVVFASKGFDGASMQDLARAAGMSAGNFYRYFPSKNAIVEAIIERKIAELRGRFAEVSRSENPLDSFRSLVLRRIETKDAADGQIWSEIAAAATRRPEAGALLARMETEVARGLVAVFARIAELPEPEAERRFSAHARLIMMLVQGVTMHCSGGGGAERADAELGALVGRMIEHTLAEVAAAAGPRVECRVEGV